MVLVRFVDLKLIDENSKQSARFEEFLSIEKIIGLTFNADFE